MEFGNLYYWLLKPWKKYAVFRGRSNRLEFATFVLTNGAILAVLTVLALFTTGVLATIARIIDIDAIGAMVLPYMAVTARRLHDIGHSGGHCVMLLVPILGQLISLTLIPLAGDEGANEYGPEPTIEHDRNKIGYANTST